MIISVIIPCFNAADTLGEELEALAQQRWEGSWEVLVADNGSTDNSVQVAEAFRNRLPNFRIVNASARSGQPYAMNKGVEELTGDTLLFCDADDVVGEGWLSAMASALEQHDFVACRIDIEKLNPPWVVKSRGGPQKDGPQPYRYPPYLPHAGGGTIGVKRSLHDAVGGFDESWTMLMDTDYCWRIQLAGTQIHFVPDAVVHVRCRNSFRKMFVQARNWGIYNVRIYKKYRQFGMPKLSWRAGARAWIDLARRLSRFSHLDKGARAGLVWALSWRVGRLWGCLKYRVLAP